MHYLARIASPDNLKAAFRHIAANRSGPGGDGVTLDEFAAELDSHIAVIASDLLADTYEFQPAMAIELAEKQRTVFVLTVRDRVVSQAIAQIVAEPMEKIFHAASYAYRPGHSAVQAAKDMYDALGKHEFTHVLRCDIHHYFDSVEHVTLYKFLEWALGTEAERTLHLMLRAVKQPCLVHGGLRETTQGICQGAPLSPLLSNLYLTPFDRYLDKRGFRHFRFCDDIAVLLRSSDEAEPIWHEMEQFLGDHLRLKLHPQKWELAAFSDGFDFLGFHFSPKGRVPSKSAQTRLHDKLTTAQDESEALRMVRQWEAFYGKGSFAPADSPAPACNASAADVPPASVPPPAVDNHLPRIVQIFLDLFRGNPDCFAESFRGLLRCGYKPVKRPLVGGDIVNHLLGKQALGIYLLRGDRVACTCLDFDLAKTVVEAAGRDPSHYLHHRHNLFQHVRSIHKMLRKAGLDPLLEDSGYKGYHLWLFCDDFVPARDVVALWQKMLELSGPAPAKARREIFPRETMATGDRLGSLIKLPLAIHPQSGDRSMFLDDGGNAVANPEALLNKVSRASYAQIKAIVEGKIMIEKTDSDITRLFAGCHVVRFLCEKAKEQHDLGHFERYILLYTLGQLGNAGGKYLHYIISQCPNYKLQVTQRYIEKKHPAPMGCRRIQEIMGEAINDIACCCSFQVPAGGYASPILHVYPQATKNLAKRIAK
jgi:group II intron reverse transcriptase/maturase